MCCRAKNLSTRNNPSDFVFQPSPSMREAFFYSPSSRGMSLATGGVVLCEEKLKPTLQIEHLFIHSFLFHQLAMSSSFFYLSVFQ